MNTAQQQANVFDSVGAILQICGNVQEADGHFKALFREFGVLAFKCLVYGSLHTIMSSPQDSGASQNIQAFLRFECCQVLAEPSMHEVFTDVVLSLMSQLAGPDQARQRTVVMTVLTVFKTDTPPPNLAIIVPLILAQAPQLRVDLLCNISECANKVYQQTTDLEAITLLNYVVKMRQDLLEVVRRDLRARFLNPVTKTLRCSPRLQQMLAEPSAPYAQYNAFVPPGLPGQQPVTASQHPSVSIISVLQTYGLGITPEEILLVECFKYCPDISNVLVAQLISWLFTTADDPYLINNIRFPADIARMLDLNPNYIQSLREKYESNLPTTWDICNIFRALRHSYPQFSLNWFEVLQAIELGSYMFDPSRFVLVIIDAIVGYHSGDPSSHSSEKSASFCMCHECSLRFAVDNPILSIVAPDYTQPSLWYKNYSAKCRFLLLESYLSVGSLSLVTKVASQLTTLLSQLRALNSEPTRSKRFDGLLQCAKQYLNCAKCMFVLNFEVGKRVGPQLDTNLHDSSYSSAKCPVHQLLDAIATYLKGQEVPDSYILRGCVPASSTSVSLTHLERGLSVTPTQIPAEYCDIYIWRNSGLLMNLFTLCATKTAFERNLIDYMLGVSRRMPDCTDQEKALISTAVTGFDVIFKSSTNLLPTLSDIDLYLCNFYKLHDFTQGGMGQANTSQLETARRVSAYARAIATVILQKFLTRISKQSVSSEIVLSIVMHNPDLIVSAIECLWHKNPNVVGKLLDTAQEIKILPALLVSRRDYEFVLDIGSLAAGRQFLNLSFWLSGCFLSAGVVFAEACCCFIIKKLIKMALATNLVTQGAITKYNSVLGMNYSDDKNINAIGNAKATTVNGEDARTLILRYYVAPSFNSKICTSVSDAVMSESIMLTYYKMMVFFRDYFEAQYTDRVIDALSKGDANVRTQIQDVRRRYAEVYSAFLEIIELVNPRAIETLNIDTFLSYTTNVPTDLKETMRAESQDALRVYLTGRQQLHDYRDLILSRFRTTDQSTNVRYFYLCSLYRLLDACRSTESLASLVGAATTLTSAPDPILTRDTSLYRAAVLAGECIGCFLAYSVLSDIFVPQACCIVISGLNCEGAASVPATLAKRGSSIQLNRLPTIISIHAVISLVHELRSLSLPRERTINVPLEWTGLFTYISNSLFACVLADTFGRPVDRALLVAVDSVVKELSDALAYLQNMSRTFENRLFAGELTKSHATAQSMGLQATTSGAAKMPVIEIKVGGVTAPEASAQQQSSRTKIVISPSGATVTRAGLPFRPSPILNSYATLLTPQTLADRYGECVSSELVDYYTTCTQKEISPPQEISEAIIQVMNILKDSNFSTVLEKIETILASGNYQMWFIHTVVVNHTMMHRGKNLSLIMGIFTRLLSQPKCGVNLRAIMVYVLVLLWSLIEPLEDQGVDASAMADLVLRRREVAYKAGELYGSFLTLYRFFWHRKNFDLHDFLDMALRNKMLSIASIIIVSIFLQMSGDSLLPLSSGLVIVTTSKLYAMATDESNGLSSYERDYILDDLSYLSVFYTNCSSELTYSTFSHSLSHLSAQTDALEKFAAGHQGGLLGPSRAPQSFGSSNTVLSNISPKFTVINHPCTKFHLKLDVTTESLCTLFSTRRVFTRGATENIPMFQPVPYEIIDPEADVRMRALGKSEAFSCEVQHSVRNDVVTYVLRLPKTISDNEFNVGLLVSIQKAREPQKTPIPILIAFLEANSRLYDLLQRIGVILKGYPILTELQKRVISFSKKTTTAALVRYCSQKTSTRLEALSKKILRHISMQYYRALTYDLVIAETRKILFEKFSWADDVIPEYRALANSTIIECLIKLTTERTYSVLLSHISDFSRYTTVVNAENTDSQRFIFTTNSELDCSQNTRMFTTGITDLQDSEVESETSTTHSVAITSSLPNLSSLDNGVSDNTFDTLYKALAESCDSSGAPACDTKCLDDLISHNETSFYPYVNLEATKSALPCVCLEGGSGGAMESNLAVQILKRLFAHATITRSFDVTSVSLGETLENYAPTGKCGRGLSILQDNHENGGSLSDALLTLVLYASKCLSGKMPHLLLTDKEVTEFLCTTIYQQCASVILAIEEFFPLSSYLNNSTVTKTEGHGHIFGILRNMQLVWQTLVKTSSASSALSLTDLQINHPVIASLHALRAATSLALASARTASEKADLSDVVFSIADLCLVSSCLDYSCLFGTSTRGSSATYEFLQKQRYSAVPTSTSLKFDVHLRYFTEILSSPAHRIGFQAKQKKSAAGGCTQVQFQTSGLTDIVSSGRTIEIIDACIASSAIRTFEMCRDQKFSYLSGYVFPKHPCLFSVDQENPDQGLSVDLPVAALSVLLASARDSQVFDLEAKVLSYVMLSLSTTTCVCFMYSLFHPRTSSALSAQEEASSAGTQATPWFSDCLYKLAVALIRYSVLKPKDIDDILSATISIISTTVVQNVRSDGLVCTSAGVSQETLRERALSKLSSEGGAFLLSTCFDLVEALSRIVVTACYPEGITIQPPLATLADFPKLTQVLIETYVNHKETVASLRHWLYLDTLERQRNEDSGKEDNTDSNSICQFDTDNEEPLLSADLQGDDQAEADGHPPQNLACSETFTFITLQECPKTLLSFMNLMDMVTIDLTVRTQVNERNFRSLCTAVELDLFSAYGFHTGHSDCLSALIPRASKRLTVETITRQVLVSLEKFHKFASANINAADVTSPLTISQTAVSICFHFGLNILPYCTDDRPIHEVNAIISSYIRMLYSCGLFFGDSLADHVFDALLFSIICHLRNQYTNNNVFILTERISKIIFFLILACPESGNVASFRKVSLLSQFLFRLMKFYAFLTTMLYSSNDKFTVISLLRNTDLVSVNIKETNMADEQTDRLVDTACLAVYKMLQVLIRSLFSSQELRPFHQDFVVVISNCLACLEPSKAATFTYEYLALLTEPCFIEACLSVSNYSSLPYHRHTLEFALQFNSDEYRALLSEAQTTLNVRLDKKGSVTKVTAAYARLAQKTAYSIGSYAGTAGSIIADTHNTNYFYRLNPDLCLTSPSSHDQTSANILRENNLSLMVTSFGWKHYAHLLVSLISFLFTHAKIETDERARLCVKNVYSALMKHIVVLRSDYPLFLIGYKLQILDAIPLYAFQLRNIIISTSVSGERIYKGGDITLFRNIPEMTHVPYIAGFSSSLQGFSSARDSDASFISLASRLVIDSQYVSNLRESGLLQYLNDCTAPSMADDRQAVRAQLLELAASTLAGSEGDSSMDQALMSAFVFYIGRYLFGSMLRGHHFFEKSSKDSYDRINGYKVLKGILDRLPVNKQFHLLSCISDHIGMHSQDAYIFSTMLRIIYEDNQQYREFIKRIVRFDRCFENSCVGAVYLSRAIEAIK